MPQFAPLQGLQGLLWVGNAQMLPLACPHQATPDPTAPTPGCGESSSEGQRQEISLNPL